MGPRRLSVGGVVVQSSEEMIVEIDTEGEREMEHKKRADPL